MLWLPAWRSRRPACVRAPTPALAAAACFRAQDQLIQRCLGKVQEWETGTNTLQANHKKHLWISPGQPGQ